MNDKKLCIGVGLGMVLFGMSALVMRPKKKCRMKKAVAKALLAMSEVVDSISDALGM